MRYLHRCCQLCTFELLRCYHYVTRVFVQSNTAALKLRGQHALLQQDLHKRLYHFRHSSLQPARLNPQALALCDQCWSTHLRCGTQVTNMRNPRLKWCNDGQPAAPGLPPHLKRLCPGGSTPAGKSAVQENVSQGLPDVETHERTC